MSSLLTVDRVCKHYRSHPALRDVSFTAEGGQIIALLGKNGAGKSTLMNIMTGYLAPTSGRVSVCGYDMEGESLKARACLGYLPEQPSLYPEMTVREYLRFCVSLKPVPKEKRRDEAERVIGAVGLAEYADRLSSSLSKGYRQRLGLAQALLGEPPLLVLDEPGSGMDPLQMAQMRDLIREVGKKSTVLLSSHMLGEFTGICSRALVLDGGQLRYDGALSDLLKPRGLMRLRFRGGEDLTARLSGLPGVSGVTAAEDGAVLRYDPSAEIAPGVFAVFQNSGRVLLEMHEEKETLEEAFLRLTGRGEDVR